MTTERLADFESWQLARELARKVYAPTYRCSVALFSLPVICYLLFQSFPKSIKRSFSSGRVKRSYKAHPDDNLVLSFRRVMPANPGSGSRTGSRIQTS